MAKKKKAKRRTTSEQLGAAFDRASNAAMEACNRKYRGQDKPGAEKCRFEVDALFVRIEKRVRRRTGLPADPTLT